jgi:hypothetical protein
MILRYPTGAPNITLNRLVALLNRYHPNWRQLITLSAITRARARPSSRPRTAAGRTASAG